MKIEDFISEIDTQRFGFRVAKINNFDFPILEILHFLKENNFKVVISKIDSANIPLLNEMEKNGFLIKDFQLTYKFILNEQVCDFSINSMISVREFTLNDLEKISDIAINSFVNYGHYSNNHIFDQKKVPQIYEDWVRRSCLDKNVADQVFIAELDNEVIGFLSLKLVASDGLNKCVFTLGAVDKRFRNKNVMKKLIYETIIWAKQNCNDWIETYVLASNYSVIKVFTDSNFFVSNSFITLHKNL